MKTKVLLLLLPLLIFCLIPQTQADVEPLSITYELNTYVETKIIVSYAFTDEVSSNASSMGKSVWQTAEDPLSSSFITSAADRFTWKLNVRYSTVITQYVTIAIFSGTEAVDSISFTATTDRLKLTFDITVTSQPRFPSVEELADKTIEVLSNELAEYIAEMRYNNDMTRQHITTQWAIIIVMACVLGITIIPKFYKRKGEQ